MNIVRQCDCLEGMLTLPSGCVDLVYLDPPFFTDRVHASSSRSGINDYEFNDIWPTRESYITFIYERVVEIVRVLKDSGSIFFHCDRSASHLIRSILDDIMGSDNFQSEIIWTYKRWSNAKKGLLQQHQNILFYSKSKDFKWIGKRVDYSPTTNIDQLLQQRERDWRGKSVYKRDHQGAVVASNQKEGVPLGDVWDIPFLNPKAKERTGYPTQKPLQLLDRIVELTTDEGDCVLDPFAGSGTTLVSASLLNRSYIGFDISADAVELINSRLAKPVKTISALLERGIKSYVSNDPWIDGHLTGFEFDRVHRNTGIDAVLRAKLGGQGQLDQRGWARSGQEQEYNLAVSS